MIMTDIRWFKYSSPQTFYPLAGKLAPWFAVAAALFAVAGLYISFFMAPTDFQQGEAYRIIFIHVPAAWMSMFLYLVMAVWAAIGLAWNTRLSSMMAIAIAPTGAIMTFIALWTGALWGKPMWGAWWVWDARLTSELILLFLYLGFMFLHAAIDDPRRADRAAAVIAIVGAINVPIIYFSVKWWNTLHQGASVSLTRSPSMAATMLLGMLVMALAFWMYSIAVILKRVRCVIIERERHADWINQKLAHLPQAVPMIAGSVIPLRGVPHRIKTTGRRGAQVLIDTNEKGAAILDIPGDPAFCSRRLRDFLQKQARLDLQKAVDHYAVKLDVKITGLTLRDSKSRWGSCSATGRLNFSWRLVMAPPFVLDYLAAHEMAHRKEMNHSARFWTLLESLTPHVAAAEHWLKTEGPTLHRYGDEERKSQTTSALDLSPEQT